MINTILKYTKSHIYELHALLAGILAFLLMFQAKKPVKKLIFRITKRKAETSRRWKNNQNMYRRRLGLSLIALDFAISAAVFWVLAMVSPLIRFSLRTMWLSGFLSLTLYSLYEQAFSNHKEVHHE